MANQSVLERIVEARAGQTLVGSVSTAVDRIAEEIATDALQDEAFGARSGSWFIVVRKRCSPSY